SVSLTPGEIMKLSNVSSMYGAPMGRRSFRPEGEPEGKIRIHYVTIDSGGYDNGGAYWGIRQMGQRLYRVLGETLDGEPIEMFRDAKCRAEVKEYVLDHYPTAKFYR